MQALVCAQQAELKQQAKELETYRQQAKLLGASQRNQGEKVVAMAAARIEAILKEQVFFQKSLISSNTVPSV